MKKLFALALLVACSLGVSSAQTTALSATVVDSDGTTWANGTWSISWTPGPSSPNIAGYRVNGAALDLAVAYQSGTLNGSGALSITVYDSSLTFPTGSGYALTVCSNTIAPCSVYNLQTAGASQNLSAALTTTIAPPRFKASGDAYGYNDGEAILFLTTGSKYWNVTLGAQRTWTGTAWVTSSGSGSGTVIGQASGIIPLPTNSTTIGAQSHLDDGITTPLTVTSSEPLIAPAVNGVLDLKAMFGAVASQATISCTTVASSTNMQCSSIGDFKIGHRVFIPTAGIVPTTIAPAGLTSACAVDNGASCAGSTVYCYEIATVQGFANGPTTAVTSPTCTTQANQVRQAAGSSGRSDVKTHVSWTAAANAGSYAVYKSINGGSYSFYALVYAATSFDDYGYMASILWNCTQIGISCTPPASAVPNDVYAQITAITGTGPYTVTFAALSPAPKYHAGFGLPTFYPSVPSVSGTFTVQHDDTPAFTAATAYLRATPSSGLTTVKMPSGTYTTHNEDPFAEENVLRMSRLANVTFKGEGTDNTHIIQSNDRSSLVGNFIFAACDAGFTCKSRLGIGYGDMSVIAYTLADPVLTGTYSVTLPTHSDAANFPAGQYVTIYTNVNGGYPNDTYGEVNLVTGSDTSTGIVTLAYPTDKYYSATLIPPYSLACPGCGATPSMSIISPAIAAKNITVQDFSYEGPNRFLNTNTVDGLTVQNVTSADGLWEDTGFLRHHYILNNHITDDSIWNGVNGLTVGAAADGDIEARGNVYTSPRFSMTNQTCSEGTTNMTWANNTFHVSGISDTGAASIYSLYYAAAPCINNNISGLQVDISNTNMASILRIGGAIGSISSSNIAIDSVDNTTAASAVSIFDPGITTDPWFVVDSSSTHFKVGNSKPGIKVSPSGSILSPYESASLIGVSGSAAVYPYYGSQTVLNLTLSGNVTSINLGSTRIAGYVLALAFIQPSSGGPYTLPANCTNSSWITGGSGIDCPNGAPSINPVASSTTYVWLYDDGTTVHLWSSNYTVIPPVAAPLLLLNTRTLTGSSYTVTATDGIITDTSGTNTIIFPTTLVAGTTISVFANSATTTTISGVSNLTSMTQGTGAIIYYFGSSIWFTLATFNIPVPHAVFATVAVTGGAGRTVTQGDGIIYCNGGTNTITFPTTLQTGTSVFVYNNSGTCTASGVANQTIVPLGTGNWFTYFGSSIWFSAGSYGLSIPIGTPTYTVGTNVTSCGCASGYTCTNTRGELTIVGGTATTGTICTVNFSAALSSAPGLSIVTQNGGAALFNIGHGSQSTTTMIINAGISVTGSTVTVDYLNLP